MHIGVFDVLNKVLFQKLTGDVSKKTFFLQVFKGFLHLLSKPLFSCVGLSFCCFEFLCFSSSLVVVVSQIKLLCSDFCFLLFGLPGFACVLCVVFFLVCFWFLLFSFFWRV